MLFMIYVVLKVIAGSTEGFLIKIIIKIILFFKQDLF